MSELYQGSQIEDVRLAWEVARAEKPGRDYLHANPDLSKEKVAEVAYEIGAAAMHAEMTLIQKPSPYDFDLDFLSDDCKYQAYEPYEYKSIPKVPNLKESPLIVEWAQIPGMKLINGRPVAGKEDMNNFGNKQIAEGKASYRKGDGRQVWNILSHTASSINSVEYVPTHPQYHLQQTFSQLQYFNAEAAENAGLETGEYIDLYSLYELSLQLPQILRELPTRASDENRWMFKGITPAKAAFVASFLNETLRLEGPIEI